MQRQEKILNQGLLQIRLTSNDQDVLFSQSVPKQTITIEYVRVEMTDATASLTAKYLDIDLGFISPSSIVTNDEQCHWLMVPLGETAVTMWNPSLHFEMLSDMKQSMNIKVYDSTGALVTGLDSVEIGISFNYIST